MKKTFVYIALYVLCASLALEAEAARTTRDLVFEDEPAPVKADTPPKTEVIAIKTTMVLKRDEKTTTVLPSTEFCSGDSVKLTFTPNIDGYVYWLQKGTSGSIAILFPGEKAGMDNAVERNKEYAIPVKGWFRFDERAGNEELLCILSPKKIGEIENIITALATTPSEAAKKIAEIESQNAQARKTRDLVFEDEDGEDVNTKMQVAPAGEPFVAHYVLIHK